MQQKNCLITGATGSIGRAVAINLAKSGAHVILVCRNLQKGESVCNQIKQMTGRDNVKLYIADLSSQQEIRNLSQQIHHDYSNLHVLINNAAVSFAEKTLSVDGIEMNLATNHLGPFLLSHLLSDLMKETASARIVNISSSAHQWAKINLHDVQFQQRNYHAMQAYAQSKLFLTMTSYELARQYAHKNISVNCIHPGVISTPLSNQFALQFLPAKIRDKMAKPLHRFLSVFMQTPEEAAEAIAYLAMSPELENVTGHYFSKKKACKSSASTYDIQLTKQIWQLSEELVNFHE